MSIKSKQRDLTPIVLPQGPPIKSVKDYFFSKNENGLMRIPECDAVGRGPGLATSRAHRDQTSARIRLKNALSEHEQRKEHMEKCWDTLFNHQQMFREAFLKFNRQVLENKYKREWAMQKTTGDSEALISKSAEVEKCEEDIQKYSTICSEMEKKLETYGIFEKYLMSVVDKYTEFKQPIDIIHRFQELTSANSTLSKNQEDLMSTIERIASEMSSMIESQKINMVGMTNQLASLKMRHDLAKNESKKWEVVLNRVKEEIGKRELEFYRVRESLWALYLNICKDKGIKASCKKQDYDGQLVMVMRGLIEIKNIVNLAEEKARTDLSSENAQKSSI